MRLLYVLALLHDAVQALRDCVRRDPDDGTVFVCVGPVRADFGDGWGFESPWLIAMSGSRGDGDELADDDHDQAPIDPSSEPRVTFVGGTGGEGEPDRKWQATPDAWKTWFQAAAAGEDIDSLMMRLELQGVGEGIEA